jgi:hypothetical protein
MADDLKNLAITNWYKAWVAVSGGAFLVALGAGRDTVALLALGAFLFGLGLWKSHKKAVGLRGGGGAVWKVTDIEYRWDWTGTLLELAGIIVFGWALYRAYLAGAFAT